MTIYPKGTPDEHRRAIARLEDLAELNRFTELLWRKFLAGAVASRCFQDTNGTIPATKDGDPVGRAETSGDATELFGHPIRVTARAEGTVLYELVYDADTPIIVEQP